MERAGGSGLDIRLVGPLAVRRGEEYVALPASRKTRALLGYLAISCGPVRRDRLCELLWDVPDDPRGSLRWNLSHLRKALGPDAATLIAADRDTVQLLLPEPQTDWHRLKHAIDRGIAEADPAALEPLAALDGDLLEGLDLLGCDIYQSWLIAHREELRRWRVAIFERLATGEDDAEVRLGHARGWIEADRHSPVAWQALIALLRETGRDDEAERQSEIAVRRIEQAGEPVPSALRYRGGRMSVRATASGAPAPRQQIRFCRASDGTGLAYAESGSGAPLVKTANWMAHLELDWQNPVWRHWFDVLSEGRRLVRYDERGNGLSDWKTTFSFEAFVDDLACVVDAAELDRFDLFGVSQGAAVAIAYAAANPDRVRRMVLFGGFPMGWATRGSAEDRERHEAMLTLTAQGWGADNPAYRQMFTSLLVPDATAEEQDAFNDMQKHATSAENAEAIQRTNASIDVSHLLAGITVPTLVAHCREDAMVPFEAGRALARTIPGARFIALDSRNHLIFEREPAWPAFITEMRAFLDAEP